MYLYDYLIVLLTNPLNVDRLFVPILAVLVSIAWNAILRTLFFASFQEKLLSSAKPYFPHFLKFRSIIQFCRHLKLSLQTNAVNLCKFYQHTISHWITYLHENATNRLILCVFEHTSPQQSDWDVYHNGVTHHRVTFSHNEMDKHRWKFNHLISILCSAHETKWYGTYFSVVHFAFVILVHHSIISHQNASIIPSS